jgi:hypothetical protein
MVMIALSGVLCARRIWSACGPTRMDKIENKNIRNKSKVTEMHRKIQENT